MISCQSERLLAYLKSVPILAGFSYSIYKPGLTEVPDEINRMLCGAQGMSRLCRGICVPFLTAVSEEALAIGKAVLFRCPRTLFIFVIPLSADSCLVCGGAISVNTEKEAQATILKLEQLIPSFISGEKTQPVDSVQPSVGSYYRQNGQQHARECLR